MPVVARYQGDGCAVVGHDDTDVVRHDGDGARLRTGGDAPMGKADGACIASATKPCRRQDHGIQELRAPIMRPAGRVAAKVALRHGHKGGRGRVPALRYGRRTYILPMPVALPVARAGLVAGGMVRVVAMVPMRLGVGRRGEKGQNDSDGDQVSH